MNARRFDQLIERWRSVASGLPDRRTGQNGTYPMADLALSAFGVFFTQCPSFLSFQQNMEKTQGRNNARSLFGVEKIPCDSQIRQMLDPVPAAELFGLFDDLHQAFQEAGLLEAMRAVKNTRLLALDAPGTSPPNPKTFTAKAAPAFSIATVGPRIITPRSLRSSSARATPRWCRCARSSSGRKMARLNRTARSTRPSAG